MKSLRLPLLTGVLLATAPAWAISDLFPDQSYVEAECIEVNEANDALIAVTIETFAFTEQIVATLTEASIAGERTLATLPVRIHPNDAIAAPTRYRGLGFDLKINTQLLPDENNRYVGRLNAKINGKKFSAELSCQLYMRPM